MTSLVAGMGPALLFAAVHAIGAGVLMGQSFPFVLFTLVGSLAGIFGLGKLRARSVLLAMGGLVAAANLLSIPAIALLGTETLGWDFAGDAVAGLAGGWFVAMLIGLILPVFEHLFHVTTDIRLLELSNQNLPLLRNLALEAPGTYQHSLMLGHLAEAAAESIGADALLARVAGLLPRHRQVEDARLLHREPAEGVQPARPARALDERARHRRARQGRGRHGEEGAASRSDRGRDPRAPWDEAHPLLLPEGADQGAGRGRAPCARTSTGTPAPSPHTRVNGILMICDAVEAASRTLIEPTPAKIRAMIQTIVDDCLRDGQFDECDLTMRDLAVIVDTLERSVSTMYHHRIDYPGFDFNRERQRRRTADTPPAEPGRSTGPRAV